MTAEPDVLKPVRDRALSLLARREHTIRELTDKLRRAGHADDDLVREVVADLADKGLVSDARYAESFVRDAVRLKPRARRGLTDALVGKGVPARTAAAAVDHVFEEADVDDATLARRVAERYLPRIEGKADEARWRRLAAHLQRRGFDNALIYDVCQSLLPEIDA